jgi:Domain of unknown function (DUF2382)
MTQLKDSNQNHISENELIPPISLLEERLIVHLDRHKIGEIIVRKEVETQIIQVPIRREKLIVEQIAPEYKQIAIIDLGRDSLTTNAEVIPDHQVSEHIVKREFESVRLASQFLEAIAHLSDIGSVSIKIEIKAADTSIPTT